jgi:hypothetical protein
LDDFARELTAKRTRLAVARARAESEDILSVAEQLLSDEVEAITAETLAQPEVPYVTEGDEYDVDYGDDFETVEGAVAESEGETELATEPAELAADGEAVAEVYPNEYDEYDEYDEYAEYDENAVYDEDAVQDEYAEYDEYADYEGLDEFTESDFETYAPEEEPAPEVTVGSSKAKSKKAAKTKDKGRTGATDTRRRRGRVDWFSYDDEP